MRDTRLHIIAEGYTEKNFVYKTLRNHLWQFHIQTDAQCVLVKKNKKNNISTKGGLLTYQQAKLHISNWLKQEKKNSDCWFTTMFDYYALPNSFPGYNQAQKKVDPYERVRIIENEFENDINDKRFIPYIQLHEFEALIFVEPGQLEKEYFDSHAGIAALVEIRKSIQSGNPELINDNPETAPSKRILKYIPDYDKAHVGPKIVESIGIKKIRQSCKHFNNWLEKLEGLSL